MPVGSVRTRSPAIAPVHWGMANNREAPCRLTVFLARDAPIGVVLRRGPSAWCQLSVWHTDTDTFEHGQWLKGRVYERRADCSADGSLFLYFTRKTTAYAPADSWLALSRPPYFTALALWFIGSTWYTGGFFPSRDAVWLGFTTAQPDQGTLPASLAVASGLPAHVERTNEWTNQTVFVNRLLRDGWIRTGAGNAETWEHRHPEQELTLLMLDRAADFHAYGGRHQTEYAVRLEPDVELYPLGHATWADWDQQGRLVVAQGGRLLAWMAPNQFAEIADFNPQTPESIEAPAWAQTWP
jgi:hypothetical protein